MILKVGSREYKLLLDHREFRNRREGVDNYQKELEGVARPLVVEGAFGSPKKRTLAFLDTPDRSLRRLGLILRSRISDHKNELTIKCRSEDRYLVSGTKVTAGERFTNDIKLEEDIAPPFACRFSLSNTVESERPTTWGAAAEVFPILAELEIDRRSISPKTELQPVNGFEAFERVYTGPTFSFGPAQESLATIKAASGLILWSKGPDERTLVAEFSFRLKDKEEGYSRNLASEARAMFERLQRHDWAAPRGTTKTQFVYGDADLD